MFVRKFYHAWRIETGLDWTHILHIMELHKITKKMIWLPVHIWTGVKILEPKKFFLKHLTYTHESLPPQWSQMTKDAHFFVPLLFSLAWIVHSRLEIEHFFYCSLSLFSVPHALFWPDLPKFLTNKSQKPESWKDYWVKINFSLWILMVFV